MLLMGQQFKRRGEYVFLMGQQFKRRGEYMLKPGWFLHIYMYPVWLYVLAEEYSSFSGVIVYFFCSIIAALY